MLATTELQQHVFDTLSGDPTVAGFVGTRILDHVPNNVVFPYLTVGEVSPAPFKTHDRDGEELAQTIHVWSRAKGWKETKLIAQAIRPLFDGVAYTTTTFEGFSTRLNSLYLRDPDGITRHAALEFRFFAHQKV